MTISLESKSAALVLIDLQKGILGHPAQPRSGEEVLKASLALSERFRSSGSAVVLVRVAWSQDGGDMLRGAVDMPVPWTDVPPPAFSEYADGLEAPADILITKRQWGAFYGTELDLQLRRRGIRTIVLGGVATNFGVESTAREAWELGYEVVFVEDLLSSIGAEEHRFAVEAIFPRIGRVTSSGNIELN